MSTGTAEECGDMWVAEPWVPLRVVLGHRLLLQPPCPRLAEMGAEKANLGHWKAHRGQIRFL